MVDSPSLHQHPSIEIIINLMAMQWRHYSNIVHPLHFLPPILIFTISSRPTSNFVTTHTDFAETLIIDLTCFHYPFRFREIILQTLLSISGLLATHVNL